MPSHTFATTNPEPLSATDDTYYAAVCVIWRPGNASAFQFSSASDITSTIGGKRMGSSDAADFWLAIPGRPVRLTELYAAGAVGDVVDLICIKPISVLPQL